MMIALLAVNILQIKTTFICAMYFYKQQTACTSFRNENVIIDNCMFGSRCVMDVFMSLQEKKFSFIKSRVLQTANYKSFCIVALSSNFFE